ncbi:MAG: Uma2 family endonuclease [Lewinellaceae bacterium]|nr:Uma2 family endonuclease [Lewinellaceae bacterium]
MSATIPAEKEITLENMVAQYGAIVLQTPLSKKDFSELAERYPDVLIEREKNGITTIMSPVKKGSGQRESTLLVLIGIWNLRHKLGKLYSPSTGFDLPDGSIKSPDAAWISNDRPDSGEEHFVQVVPDFVAEIRSGSDPLKKLQRKMTDTWIANGVRLAWLIDPYDEKVYIYRPGEAVRIVAGFSGKTLAGEDVLPGFELPLEEMMRGK